MNRVATERRRRYRIGNLIRVVRESKGLSRRELSELSEIHINTIERVERGTVGGKRETIKAICGALGVEVQA